MSRAKLRMLAVGAGMAAAVAVTTPVPAAQAAGSAAPQRAAACSYNVPSQFLRRWNDNHGADGGFGCPVQEAFQYGNGLYQWFAKGAMVWSPNQGANMVTSVQRWGAGLRFDWGLSDGYNYDGWLINIRRDGQDINGDQECIAHGGGSGDCGRYDGTVYWNTLQPGQYRISVEGCDIGSGHTCRQGWTLPVYEYL
ncbi:hypothetical protein [Streptomyces noboritoensis]